MIHVYEISGMHCNRCIEKVKTALVAIDGVVSASVTLSPPEAIVEMTRHISTESLNKSLGAVGEYHLTDKALSSYSTSANTAQVPESLKPLFVIVSYLVGAVFVRALIAGDFTAHSLMSNFMGGFFVLFSLFKMIDVKGFAEGYSTYDIVAKRSDIYAKIYPFIELTLGLLYLIGIASVATNILTLALMSVGSIGVIQALRQKRSIQCACLGTALKLPMTKVTLAEDVGMGLMALIRLFL